MGRVRLYEAMLKALREDSVIHDSADHAFTISKKFHQYFHPFLRNGSLLIGLFLTLKLFNNPPQNLLLLSCYVLGIVLCLMVFFARHGLVINPRKKRYMHSIYLFGLPLGAENKYENIEKLYINRNHGVYCCYIKFRNGEKFLFDTNLNKDNLVRQLLEDNIKLGTHIYDQTLNPNDPIRIN